MRLHMQGSAIDNAIGLIVRSFTTESRQVSTISDTKEDENYAG